MKDTDEAYNKFLNALRHCYNAAFIREVCLRKKKVAANLE